MRDLRNIRNSSLYKFIPIIQQDVFIFNSSVRNNISMFNDYDTEKLDQAIRLADLEKFIDKKGLDSPVGETSNRTERRKDS